MLRRTLQPPSISLHLVRQEEMDLKNKSAQLSTHLRSLGSLLVAYSGGTDSAFLAWAAHQALGERMLAARTCACAVLGPKRALKAGAAFEAALFG